MPAARHAPAESAAAPRKNEPGYPEMWRLAWPVSVSTSTFMLLMVANLFWIGRLGTEAVAAISLTSHILFMAFGLTQIVFVGTVAVVARRTGEGDPRAAYAASIHSLVLGLLLGVAVSASGYLAAGPLIAFFETEPGVAANAVPYLEVTFAGHFFFFLSMGISSSYQGTGNTRIPMVLSALVAAFNAILDPVLMFSPGDVVLGGVDLGIAGLGVVGAAVADVLATALGCGLSFALFASRWGPYPREVRRWVPIQLASLWQILRIGVPASVTMLARPLSTFFLLKVIATFGTAALAGFGIVLRAFSLNFIPFSGLNAAVSTLVGQRLGAAAPNEAQHVVRRGLVIAVALSLAFCALYVTFAEPMIAAFDADPEVIRVGIPFLWIIAIGQVFTGPTMPLAAAMNGAGDTRPPMLAALLSNWPIKLPLAYVLAVPMEYGTSGVWMGMLGSMLLEASLLTLWFRRGHWRTKAV